MSHYDRYPLVSIILPFYNSEKYLRLAITSLITQSYSNIEVVAINDGSNDRSIEIIKDLYENRINVLSNEINKGLVYSLNKGIAVSSGEYLARMDADDICMPDRIEKQVLYLEANPEISVIGTNYQLIDDIGNEIKNTREEFFPIQPKFVKWLLFFGCPIAHPTAMMRKNVIQMYGGYDQSYKHAEDYELWVRINQERLITNIDEELMKIRLHSNQVSRMFTQSQKENSDRVSQKAISLFLGKEISLKHAGYIRNYRRITDINETNETATLLHSLFKSFIRMQKPNIYELRNIRLDASNRMFELAILASKQNFTYAPKIWTYFLLINPLNAIKMFRRFFTFTNRHLIIK